MGQVATVAQVESHDLGSWLEQSQKDRSIGLCP